MQYIVDGVLNFFTPEIPSEQLCQQNGLKIFYCTDNIHKVFKNIHKYWQLLKYCLTVNTLEMNTNKMWLLWRISLQNLLQIP